jgi:hypothetical protein
MINSQEYDPYTVCATGGPVRYHNFCKIPEVLQLLLAVATCLPTVSPTSNRPPGKWCRQMFRITFSFRNAKQHITQTPLSPLSPQRPFYEVLGKFYIAVLFRQARFLLLYENPHY